MLAEIQQNSDITYRLYDYDRLTDGKKRELHIDKSIDVITAPFDCEGGISDYSKTADDSMAEFVDCERFTAWKINVKNGFSFEMDKDFMTMTVIDGNGIVNDSAVKKGDSFILPCGIGKVTLEGQMTLIASSPKG